jgi:tungstate transport system substrate-binding protein
VVEVKKPGSTRWSYSSNRGITKTGAWLYRYMPRLKGTYQFRARYTTRYGTRVSSVVSMWLKTQPVWDLYVASTTSTTDSGLFETIIPLFQKQYPYWRVKVLSLGSGPALQTARDGASDVLLTHEPVGEAKLVADGKGFNYHSVMYNHFVLVGPSSDPAGIKTGTSATSIVAAFEKVRTAGVGGTAKYVARKGSSGTAVKNTQIWKLTADGLVTGSPSWYVETDAGMGPALIMANNQTPTPYILTDTATYANIAPAALNSVVSQGDPLLVNPYSVMQVTNPKGNAAGAADFSNWIRGSAGQYAIGQFGVLRFGKQLFTPWVVPAAGAF